MAAAGDRLPNSASDKTPDTLRFRSLRYHIALSMAGLVFLAMSLVLLSGANASLQQWIITAVFTFLGAVAGYLMGGWFTEGLVELNQVLDLVLGGDLNARSNLRTRNEAGLLAARLNRFIEYAASLGAGTASQRQDQIEQRRQLEERSRELEASQRVTFAASERVSPGELLGLVVNLIRDQFNLYHVQVYLVNQERGSAVLTESTGYAGRQLLQQKHEISLNTPSLISRTINEGKPIIVDDVSTSPDYYANPLLPETRSELVVPLRVGGRVMGALDAQDRNLNRFSEHTAALFQTMAEQVAFLFENSELLARTQEQTEALNRFTVQLRTGAEIAGRISSILDLDRLLGEVVELMQSRFGLYHVHIYLLDEAGEKLVVQAGSGEVGRVLRERKHQLGLNQERSVVSRAAREQHGVLINDTTLASDFTPNPLLPQTRSELAVPLVVGGRVLGVLDVQDDQVQRFSEADVDTFNTLAGQIANAVQNARFFSAQQRLQQELHRSEQKFREIVARAQTGIFRSMMNGQLAEANPHMLQTLGFSTIEELNAVGLSKVYVNIEDRQKLWELAQQGPVSGFEAQVRRADGQVIPILISAILVRDENGQPAFMEGAFEDIKERKAAEAEVRESAAKIRAMFDAITDGITFTDLQGRIVDVNEATLKLHGYASREALLGKISLELVSEKEREAAIQNLAYTAETGFSGTNEYNLLRGDGSTFSGELTAAMVRGSEGQPIGFIAVSRDITARKQIEEVQRENEERMQTILASIPAAVVLSHPQKHSVLFANKEFSHLFRVPLNEFIGSVNPDFIANPDDGARMMALYRQQGFVKNYEAVMRRPDGSTFWGLLSADVVQFSDEALILRTILDISERKEAERIQEEYAQRLNIAAEIATKVGSILDPDLLLETTIPLLKERFDLYHVHVYTLDAENQDLVLRAGYGEPGRIMRERGHRIPMTREQSLVARAARSREIVVVDDVAQAPDFLPNPLLPATRSEAAVPVVVGDRLFGVFDVQDDAPERFGPSDVDVFRTLAGQIGAALQNAELYRQSQNERLFYDGILTNLPVGVWAVDNQFNIRLVNRAAQSMMGREVKSGLGGETHVEAYDVINTETGEKYDESRLPIVNAVTQGIKAAVSDIGVKWPEGKVVPMLINAAPLTDVDGEQIGGVAIIVDLTDLKAAQAETQRLLQETEVRLHINEALAEAHTEEEVLDTIIRMGELYPQIQVTLFTFEGEENDQSVTVRRRGDYQSGIVSQRPVGMRFPVSRYPILKLVAAHDSFVSPNFMVDERVDAETRALIATGGGKSLAMIPITVGNDWIGGLGLLSATEGDFDEAKLRFYEALADQGAVALRAAQLRDALELTQASVDEALDSIFWADEKLRIIRVNRTACEKFGYTEKEFFSMTLTDLDAQQDNLVDWQSVQKLMQERRFATTIREHRTKDGTVFPVELALHYMEYGGQIRYFTFVRDITERKLAEEERERLVAVLESSSNYVGISAPDGTLIYMNKALRDLGGLGDDAVLSHYTVAHFYPEEQIAQVMQETIPTALEMGIWRGESVLLGADGRRVPVMSTVIGRKDAQGNPLYLANLSLDVTDIKRAEATAREAAAKTRAIFDAMTDGIAATDMRGHLIDANDANARMLGYASREEMLTLDSFDIVVPEEAERARAGLMKTLREGASGIIEYHLKRRDGSVFEGELNSALMRNAEGQPIGFVAMVRDITERKQVEAERERLTAVLNASPDFMAMAEPDGKIIYLNPAARQMVGIPLDVPVENYTIADFYEPEEAERVLQEVIPIAVASGSWSGESTLRRQDSRLVPTLATIIARRDAQGKLLYLANISRDITEIKRAEAEVQESEARIRAMFDAITDGVTFTNLQGVVVDMNQSTLKLHGFDRREELLGLTSLELVAEADHPKALSYLSRLVELGTTGRLEYHLKRKDGSLFDGELTSALVRSATGDPLGYVAVSRDITERKQAEAERERLTSILESTTDFVGVASPDGRGIYFNRAGREMVGISADTLPEDYIISDLTPVSELARTMNEIIPTALEQGTWHGESVMRALDGREIPVLQVIIAKRDERGNLLYLANVARDISAIKQAESERAHLISRLSTAAEIAVQIGSILDPDELLAAVIPLLKERFELYHVHFYSLDEGARELLLRAGYGEPGRIMRERGHKIALDREQSLVARAARSRESVVVADVTTVPDFLPNPLLPATRSEVAVPALAGGKVVGVFDVQHDVPDFFTEADLSVFRSLAGQIAAALQNAELYRQSQNERAFYDGILTNLPIGVWAVDNQFNIRLVNPTAKQMLGRELTDRGGGTYVESYEVINVDTGTKYEETALPLVKAVTQGIKATVNDAGVRWPDGTVVPMLINAAPLTDVEGQQSGAVVIFADTTEQKKAQAEVQRLLDETKLRLRISQVLSTVQSEDEVLDALIELASFDTGVQVGVLTFEPNAPELTATLRRQAVFASGTRTAMPVGSSFSVSQFAILNLVTQATYFVSPNALTDMMVDPGTREYVEAVGGKSLVLLPIAASQEWLGVITLLSSQEKYFDGQKLSFYRMLAEQGADALREARLRDTLKMTQAAVDQALDAIFWSDADLRILGVNQKACAALGYSEKELLAMRISDVDAEISPESWAGMRSILLEQKFLRGESSHRTREGRVFPVDLAINLIEYGGRELYFTFVRDLTERKQAEAEIRASAAKIRAMFDAITDGITFTDMEGKIVDTNESTVRLHGWSREEILGRLSIELIAPEEHMKAYQSLAETAHTGVSGIKEYNLARKDGTYFEGELSATMVRDSDGLPIGFVAVTRDITDRKRAEDALRLSQLYLRSTIDAIGDLIYVVDRDWKIVLYNSASEEWFKQLNIPTLMDKQLFDVLSFLPSEVRLEYQRVFDSGESVVTEDLVELMGQTFYSETRRIPIFEGERVVRCITVVRDITERKLAEEERTRFTTQLRTAAEIAGQIGRILDPDQVLEAVIPLLKERFDLYHVHVYTLDEESRDLVMRYGYGEPGRIMREQGHRIPLDREQSLVAQAARSQEIVAVDDVTHSPNFLPNPLLPATRSEVAIPVAAAGKVLGVFDVQSDVPQRFTLSDLDVFNTLAGQIAAALQNARLFEEIQLTAHRAQEMDRLKSEFLANMSHELRTPLNSILGYTEVMLLGIDGEIDPEMLQDVAAIHENGQHLLRIINDILDLAKIEAGRMILSLEDVELDMLLDDVRTSNLGLLHKMHSPVDLDVEVEEELPTVRADRVRLNQILNNLVSNAVKFTEKGTINIKAYRDDAWICIAVQDTGIGMDEKDLKKLFQKFQQVDGSSTRRAEGTGLGLVITRYLVEMHNGDIQVVSEKGKGTTFIVRLPAPVADAAE